MASMDLTAVLTQTHSVRHFTQRVADDLYQGLSTVVLFPRGPEPISIWQIVYELLWQRDCDVTEVLLPALAAEEPALGTLSKALGVKWSTTERADALDHLVANRDLPDVILLRGFEQLTEGQRDDWLALVRRWAEAVKAVEAQTRRPSALCLMIRAESLPGPPPTPSVWLSVRWWWAIPSTLEMHTLCRFGTDSSSHELDLQSRWREYLLPSLVGNDVELTQALWNKVSLGLNEIVDCLNMWATRMGWTQEALRSWGVRAVTGHGWRGGDGTALEPPVRQRELWARGLLKWTPEYGVMLSAAALAALEEYPMLEHRLWRGQVGLLLPLVDRVRLSLCERWTLRYGINWPWFWQPPKAPEEMEAVRNNPFASGLGHIEALLLSRLELRNDYALLPLVSHARYVRNKLAHYQPVTFQDFEVLWYGSQAL